MDIAWEEPQKDYVEVLVCAVDDTEHGNRNAAAFTLMPIGPAVQIRRDCPSHLDAAHALEKVTRYRTKEARPGSPSIWDCLQDLNGDHVRVPADWWDAVKESLSEVPKEDYILVEFEFPDSARFPILRRAGEPVLGYRLQDDREDLQFMAWLCHHVRVLNDDMGSGYAFDEAVEEHVRTGDMVRCLRAMNCHTMPVHPQFWWDLCSYVERCGNVLYRPPLGGLRETLDARAERQAELLERLAQLEHEQWSHWFRYTLQHLTPENLERWTKQAHTPYQDLTDAEKEKDRKWARHVMDALKGSASGKEFDVSNAASE